MLCAWLTVIHSSVFSLSLAAKIVFCIIVLTLIYHMVKVLDTPVLFNMFIYSSSPIKQILMFP